MRPHAKSPAGNRRVLAGLFTDRKISTKIAIGFGSLLAITMLISGTAYFVFGTVARDFSGSSVLVQNSGIFSAIDRQFLTFQSYAEDSTNGLAEDIANAKKAQTAVRAQIEGALATIKTPDQLQAIKSIDSRFQTYSKDFDTVAPIQLALQQLAKDALNPAGARLLTDLQQLHISEAKLIRKSGQATNGGTMILFGEAISTAMQLRLDIEKVTVKYNAALIKSARQEFSNLELTFAQIEKTPDSVPLHQKLESAKAETKAYKESFETFATRAAVVERVLHIGMTQTARRLGDEVAAIKANSLAVEKQTQRQLSDRIVWVRSIILIFALGSLALGLVLAWLIGRTISRPVVALVPELKKMADGDFSVALSEFARKDEIGEISAAVEMVVDKIGGTINNIKMAANEVTNASAEISTSTTDLSQRTEEQAASLEQTSASMEEIAATVKKNAENARQANEFAAETNVVAEHGGAVVGEAVSAMARIEEASRKISDIIGVIDEIARQTNLLALNAAVEAARAGEAGRGFAVVASEVRSLAQRSSQAAKDIKDLITNSNSLVENGVDLVNKAGESLNAIVASIKKVTDIVADIANASMEQSTGIEQINRALTQMDEVTQQNTALVEQNAATAKTLEHQARSIDERVAIFQLRAAGQTALASGTARRANGVEPRAVRPQPAALPSSRGPAALMRAKVAVSPAPAASRPKHQPAAAAKSAAGEGGGPVGKMHSALAAAVNSDPDWTEF